MTLSEHAARKLVRLNELSLVDASFPPGLESMSLTHLKQRIQRAHRLMTKYRDMAEQQRGEARGKRTPTRRRPANGNAGTVEKQHLFAEVLARLEEQLAARLAAAPNAGQHGVFAPVERHVPIDVAATLHPPRGTAGEALELAAESGVASQLAHAKAASSAQQAESRQAMGPRSAMQFAKQGEAAHLAHGAARGRRQQARRDGGSRGK